MLFLILLALEFQFASGHCPDGWMIYRNACYAFLMDEVNWYDAREICLAIGGQLVQIDSPEENDFIAANIFGRVVWIGLHDHLQEMHFVWVDTRQRPKYTNWNAGEPNSINPVGEDCTQMGRVAGGWDDASCQYLRTPVCETRCPMGWVFRHNSCYAVIDDGQTWFDAQLICTTLGGHLVEIDSEEENNYATAIAKTLGKALWIGLHDHLQEMNFEWVKSRKVPVYTNWYTTEPNSFQGSSEDCVELLGGPFWGKWNDARCTEIRSSLCETSTR